MTQGSDERKDGKILVRVDPDLADLIPGFLENRRRDMGRIWEALARNDYETIRILGHSMKGSGGGYGFDAITEIGDALERAAKNADCKEMRKQIDELTLYLHRVEVIYD